MNAANLLKWIIDLETTTAPQAKEYLKKEDGYCYAYELATVSS